HPPSAIPTRSLHDALPICEDGTVQDFVEKPLKPQGNLAFAGLMLATPQLLDVIPAKENPDIGFDVLPNLAGRMLAYKISDYLIEDRKSTRLNSSHQIISYA